jgi:hypothetical protein
MLIDIDQYARSMEFWVTVGLGVLAGALVLVLIWIKTESDAVHDRHEAAVLRADMSSWLDRVGWTAAEPPPALTAGWLDQVIDDERHILAASGSWAGRPAAIVWSQASTSEAELRYATLLVELPAAYPTLRLAVNQNLPFRSRNPPQPDGPSDRRFDRRIKVGAHAGRPAEHLLTEPVRAAVLQLQRVTAWHGDFFVLVGRVSSTTPDRASRSWRRCSTRPKRSSRPCQTRQPGRSQGTTLDAILAGVVSGSRQPTVLLGGAGRDADTSSCPMA